MKRVILILFALCLSLYLKAQSILGIPFGSSYQTTKDCLESRYGKFNVFESEGKLKIYDLEIGGYTFEYGSFYFQRQGTVSWLYYVEFQKIFSTTDVSIAKKMRDSIFRVLNEKYNVDDAVNNQGFKYYLFGDNPKDKDCYLGSIDLSRSKGKDGKERLYLILSYGPIYYINKSSDF